MTHPQPPRKLTLAGAHDLEKDTCSSITDMDQFHNLCNLSAWLNIILKKDDSGKYLSNDWTCVQSSVTSDDRKVAITKIKDVSIRCVQTVSVYTSIEFKSS